MDPTKILLLTTTHDLDDDDITVQTSNLSQRLRTTTSYRTRALEHLLRQEVAGGIFQLPTKHAIADSGTTQIFVMEGTPVRNKRPTTWPLKVALADGRIVTSTHMCDITIDGLPVMLTGHIIPDLSIALLFGIRVLTEAGCNVTFTRKECIVQYNGKIILRGAKDPTTDLWTLPLGSQDMTSQFNISKLPLAAPVIANAHAHLALQIAFFAHTVRTKANSIRLSHQSLCSLPISSLLKAVKRGYLKGCSNLSAHGVIKYLNPSPATAKGHMKRPRQGIRSTRRFETAGMPPARDAGNVASNNTISIPDNDDPEDSFDNMPMLVSMHTNIIANDHDSDANVFVFAAFTDK